MHFREKIRKMNHCDSTREGCQCKLVHDNYSQSCSYLIVDVQYQCQHTYGFETSRSESVVAGQVSIRASFLGRDDVENPTRVLCSCLRFRHDSKNNKVLQLWTKPSQSHLQSRPHQPSNFHNRNLRKVRDAKFAMGHELIGYIRALHHTVDTLPSIPLRDQTPT